MAAMVRPNNKATKLAHKILSYKKPKKSKWSVITLSLPALNLGYRQSV